MQEDEDRTEDVGQRLKDVGEDHDHVSEAVAEVVFCGHNRRANGDGKQPQVTPTSEPPAVPGRRVVPARNRRTGCPLALQRVQHVEPRGSAGGEDDGADPGHHR